MRTRVIFNKTARLHYLGDPEQLHAKYEISKSGEIPDGERGVFIGLTQNDANVEMFARARQKGWATLCVVDGIFEFRAFWESWVMKGRPHYHPLVSDRIAVMGEFQRRLLEGHGVQGKTEVVGAPRFDGHAPAPKREPDETTRSILIASANRPWIKKREMRCVLQSLSAVRDALATCGWNAEWRLTQDLAERLGVVAASRDVPLPVAVSNADAVVSTPSTVLLESMLIGRPTAILDYFGTPQWLPCAWWISRDELALETLRSMVPPSPTRLAWQSYVLQDQLRTDGPAAPRMQHLVDVLGQYAREGRLEDLPYPIVERPAGASADIDLPALFPRHPVFGQPEAAVNGQIIGVLLKRLGQKRKGSLIRRAWRRFKTLLGRP